MQQQPAGGMRPWRCCIAHPQPMGKGPAPTAVPGPLACQRAGAAGPDAGAAAATAAHPAPCAGSGDTRLPGCSELVPEAGAAAARGVPKGAAATHATRLRGKPHQGAGTYVALAPPHPGSVAGAHLQGWVLPAGRPIRWLALTWLGSSMAVGSVGSANRRMWRSVPGSRVTSGLLSTPAAAPANAAPAHREP